MECGCQLLNTVVAEAGKRPGQLEQDFNVAVLLLIDAEAEPETSTVISAVGRPLTGAQPQSYVVPLQARYAKPAGDPRLSFGRSGVCDVALPFAAVSKHHGFFTRVDGGWTIADVGSTNGTLVNGKAIATGQPVLLSDGATVTFGQLSARFLTPASFVAVLRQRLKA